MHCSTQSAGGKWSQREGGTQRQNLGSTVTELWNLKRPLTLHQYQGWNGPRWKGQTYHPRGRWLLMEQYDWSETPRWTISTGKVPGPITCLDLLIGRIARWLTESFSCRRHQRLHMTRPNNLWTDRWFSLRWTGQTPITQLGTKFASLASASLMFPVDNPRYSQISDAYNVSWKGVLYHGWLRLGSRIIVGLNYLSNCGYLHPCFVAKMNLIRTGINHALRELHTI
jgi:hypothetical protein